MSRFHVTAGQWQAYARETHTVLPDGDNRPGRLCKNGKPSYPQGPSQPAVCMTWEEARGYIGWLAKKTGKPYRMVSEAEREYAGRAAPPAPSRSPSTSKASIRSASMPTPTGRAMASPIRHRSAASRPMRSACMTRMAMSTSGSRTAGIPIMSARPPTVAPGPPVTPARTGRSAVTTTWNPRSSRVRQP